MGFARCGVEATKTFSFHLISEDEVKEEDKIRLNNDRIFIHALEGCGGGVIYLKEGKYEWIQQE